MNKPVRMYLVTLFLPLADNKGRRFDGSIFVLVRKELTERYGGLTSYSRAPAHGVIEDGGEWVHDDNIVMEVMVDTLDREWWNGYRLTLEQRFRQDEILIRACAVEKL
jgi:hypothetical protein